MTPGHGHLKVLLLGNYANDKVQSMQRFADTLRRELPRHGIQVESIRPEPLFGKLKPAATGMGKWLGYIDKFIVFPFVLRKKLGAMTPPFVVHICDHSNAHYVHFVDRVPHLVTCNDLLAIRSARGEIPWHRTSRTGKGLQRLILRGLKRARRFTCISEATRKDLLRITQADPERVSVTYMGQNHPYSAMDRREAATRLRAILPNADLSRFILHVGSNDWYKNRLGVIRIYHALTGIMPGAPALVMAGKPFTAEMTALVESAGLRERVFSLVDVSNEELRALYSAANLLLFPSLAEGFGWPIIEAQACGCRVVTSGRAPMTEVGGDAAIYVDPENEPEAAQTTREVLRQDPVQETEWIAKGLENASRFPTERMVLDYVRIYRELAGLKTAQFAPV